MNAPSDTGAPGARSARIGTMASLAEGIPRRVDVDGTPVCVVRIGDRVHAIGDVCTHQDVSLSEGEVDADECTVECAKHGSAFALETGAPRTLPATVPVAVHRVAIEGDEVVVHLAEEQSR